VRGEVGGFWSFRFCNHREMIKGGSEGIPRSSTGIERRHCCFGRKMGWAVCWLGVLLLLKIEVSLIFFKYVFASLFKT